MLLSDDDLHEIEDVIGYCQHITEFNKYGQPAATCSVPAVEYRPDRWFVRFVCREHQAL